MLSINLIEKWEFIGTGGCTGLEEWNDLGFLNSLAEAKKIMMNHETCSQDGSVLFYSNYSYEWGAKCMIAEDLRKCIELNENWKKYLLSYVGMFLYIFSSVSS